MSEQTIEQLAFAVGEMRARFDIFLLGHFDNRYPINTPEHEGYEKFATPIRARIYRGSHAMQQHQS